MYFQKTKNFMVKLHGEIGYSLGFPAMQIR